MVERLRGELGAIVDANLIREPATLTSNLGEINGDGSTGEGPLRDRGQALPREDVDQRHHTERRARRHRVVHEVHGPLLIGTSGQLPLKSTRGAPPSTWPAAPQAQPLVPVEWVDPFGIHGPSLPSQVHVNGAVPRADTDDCNLPEAAEERLL